MSDSRRSDAFVDARSQFDSGRGYLSAATAGLPTRSTVRALEADLTAWRTGALDPGVYDGVVARSRAHFARIAGIPTDRVAIGAMAAPLVGVIASAVPTGAEVLLVEGDFSSLMFPFLQRADIRSRVVPLAALADSVADETWLVAFSLVQSATGEVADVAAVREAAARHGARTLCDLTQAAGVLPVDASLFDATVCHTYKWLCAPRGVSFMTVSAEFQPHVAPTGANWFGGADVWGSIYGPAMQLAPDARRYDTSPAWAAWAGAEPALELFAGLDARELWAHSVELGDALCDGLGIARQGQAIITWPDADGGDLARLRDAGIRVAGRAGRLRASFHLWNDHDDVDAVLRILR